MPSVFVIQCPFCKRKWESVAAIYAKGPDFVIKCPYCLKKFKREEGNVIAANFAKGD